MVNVNITRIVDVLCALWATITSDLIGHGTKRQALSGHADHGGAVRFRVNSGHHSDPAERPLLTQSKQDPVIVRHCTIRNGDLSKVRL